MMAEAQAFLSQFNAADMVWIVGAVILGILAVKVAAKVLKFVLIAGLILLLVVFLFSSGVIPPVF
jgi:hypothetical protein